MAGFASFPIINFAAHRAFARRLQLSSSEPALPYAPREPVALYLHIPFCQSLCSYCTFHRQLLDEPLARAYFQALRQEISSVHEAGWQVGQIYIGGGTPTVLIDELSATLALTNRLFEQPVTSVETNPNHLTADVLQPLQDAGISRLSVGVQSLDEALLARMNRLEAYGNAQQIMARLAEVNGQFDTVNVDMIFNLPGQSEHSLRNDLSQLTDLGVKQISWYPLMPNGSNQQRLQDSLGDYRRRQEWPFYQLICQQLGHRYNASSAWCFNRSDITATDEYIVDYSQYLGLGSGAFSYINRSLLASSFSIAQYIERIGQGRSPLVAEQRFNEFEWLQYQLLLQLFSLQASPAYSGSKRAKLLWASEWKALQTLGAVEKRHGRWLITQRGQYLALVLMREFFVAVNQLRDQMLKLVADESRIQLTSIH